MLTTISSQIDEMEVINILKRIRDKKTDRVTKSPAFLFSTTIWSHLAHSWPGVNYTCKVKCKTL